MLLPRSAPPSGLRHPKAGAAGALQIFPKRNQAAGEISLRFHKISLDFSSGRVIFFFLKKFLTTS